MGITGRNSRGGSILLALAALLLALFCQQARAEEDDKELRKQALALNDLTGTDAMRGKADELSKSSDKAKKLLAVAAKMAKDKDQPFNRNAAYVLAVVADDAKEVDISATFYRLSIGFALKILSEQGIAEGYDGLIQMYYFHKKYADCEKVCKEFLAIEGEENDIVERLKTLVMRRMALAIVKQGQLDRAIKMVDEMIKVDPKNWLSRALKAQVYKEGEKLEDAAKTYLDVIDRIRKDARLEKEEQDDFIDEYRQHLSNIYIELNQIDKATEQLKILLARDPNNPTWNNDLGYIWADRGMNLPEAEKYIRKAIDEDRKLRKKRKVAEDKDNAAYLDSLGWVLHKQGKHKEAKPHLLAAVKDKEGQHIEILDHLADVHMALGEKTEAIDVWKKAIAAAGDSKRDLKRKGEVEKKLKAAEGK